MREKSIKQIGLDWRGSLRSTHFANHLPVKGKPSQRGMTSLSAILIFTMVAGLLIAAAVSRNISLARDLHRNLLDKQAQWLVESAIERAAAQIQAATDPLSLKPCIYTERIAPAYVMEDPLDGNDESDSSRIITACYSFRIQPAGKELIEQGVEKAYIIHAQCDIPYRTTSLIRKESRLYSFSTSDGWKNQPLVSSHPS